MKLSVSYVSIFVMVYHIFFWVLGGAASLQWDFLPDVPQGEEALRRVAWHEKPIGSLIHRYLHGRVKKLNRDVYNPDALEAGTGPGDVEDTIAEENTDPDIQLARRVSRLSATPSHISRSRHYIPEHNTESITPSPSLALQNLSETTLSLNQQTTAVSMSTPPRHPPRWERIFPPWFVKTVRLLSVIVTPVTITLAISLPISVIPPLKALFTDATESGGPDWTGPDGSPPLNFVMETGTSI